MPQAIPFIAAALAPAGTAFTIGSIAVSYAAVAAAGASLLVGAYSADRARRQARAAHDASFQDRTLTLRSAVAPRTLVLGTVRVGGALMYADTVGPNSAYLDQVLAAAAVQCESFRGVYLNEEYLAASDISSERPTTGKYSTSKTLRANELHTLSAATTITVAHTPLSLASITISRDEGEGGFSYITPSSFGGTTINIPSTTGTVYVQYDYAGGPAPLRVQVALGSTSQAATAWSGVTTPKWGTDHRLRGIANIRTLFEWSENAYGPGAPSVEPVMRGPYDIWDPRISGYLTHTSNPALLARWFMVLPRIQGGCGIPDSWIDDATVIEAANVCDELISVKKFDGSGYENVKRYECHTLLSVEAAPLDNLDTILSAMAGDRAFTAGKYRIVAGAFRSAAVTITDADVYAGDAIDVGSFAARQVLPNMATGTFRDARRHWVETGAAPVVNSAYVSGDGYGEEPVDVTLAASTDERQANYLMGVALELARGGAEIGLTVKGLGANIRLLQSVQLDLTHYSAYAGMTFTVVRYRDEFNGRYRLLLRQTKASTYALDADRYTPVAQPAAADTSYLWNVAAVAGLGAAIDGAARQPDGKVAARMTLSWTLHSQEYVKQSGRIELRYRRVDEAAWADIAPAQGGDTSTTVSVVFVDKRRYEVQARAINGVGAFSKWVPLYVDVDGTTFAIGGGNLLSNSSFEVDADADGLADGWQSYTSGTTGTPTPVHSTGGVAGGMMQSVTASNLGASASDQVGIRNVTPLDLKRLGGQPFVLSVYANGDATGVPGMRMSVDFYSAAGGGGSLLSTSQAQFDAISNTMRRYRLRDTIPAAALSAYVYFMMQKRSGGAGAAAMNFDAAQFEIGAVETNFAPRADEILAGAVDTPELADEAATSVLTATSSSGSASIAYSAIGFDCEMLVTAEYTATLVRGASNPGELCLGIGKGSAPIGGSLANAALTIEDDPAQPSLRFKTVKRARFAITAGEGGSTIYFASSFAGVTPGGPSESAAAVEMQVEIVKR